ncbi:hypothetical protein LTR78_004739 [Recurvomyces mirabilis]|uniref:Uncharacterized protein n=1 Tax=Recurvomyces mirabilis TaxID=574656 RepID=A0AAE1C247_9PEZI|nr:hypothetical protein LTR78_004739 [Recurvomyces mirabilis]KAK5157911.1 hypothetical protein LTS14_003833 [Recurvomyces mirabilis]
MSTSDSRKPQQGNNQQYRAEITARTNAGESCKQIADTLNEAGFNISAKTVSRWRIDWGLRRRSENTMEGTVRPALRVPRPERVAHHTRPSKTTKVDRHELEQLTQEGKTATQIAALLEAKGVELRAGEKTVYRLQTFWNLIPADQARTKKRSSKKKASGEPKGKANATERDAPAQDSDGRVLHYPANCSFGPQKRARAEKGPSDVGPGATADDDEMSDSDIDSDLEDETMLEADDDGYQAVSDGGQFASQMEPVVGANDVMSAELLVDLATSSLIAANRLKDLILAAQMRRSVPGSGSKALPTLEGIAVARRKVREAASVVMDLALG